MPPKAVEAVNVETDNPADFETKNVHAIYDAIASHFSSTRYKPWPIIAAFLNSIPTGWVGLDSGTGNGKYLPLPADRPGHIWTIGMDMSRNLLEFAKTAGGIAREVVQGNVIDNGWRGGAFDYAISIATIHHLATPERRQLAVQRLIQAVAPDHGRILIYVWAIEQDELSKRAVPTEEEAQKQGKDVVVPWVLNKGQSPSADTTLKKEEVYNRYYHMFAKGELGALVVAAAKDLGVAVGQRPEHPGNEGLEIVQDGWERSNYYVEIQRWRT
ncbi:S-adenosyl-L-methionine-dependent methyltransferase [Coprinopsis sp. MPI-PUGE-AT-0042]|nr:S-adenosyl-L-methionine-dependent methyltransferase [Coprinopsis sp. MPI-PUGE-AT-0042]